jgi:hypothetical protein
MGFNQDQTKQAVSQQFSNPAQVQQAAAHAAAYQQGQAV